MKIFNYILSGVGGITIQDKGVGRPKMDPALLEWDEPGGVGGTDTRTTVLDWLVGDRELAQVVSDHLRLKKKD